MVDLHVYHVKYRTPKRYIVCFNSAIHEFIHVNGSLSLSVCVCAFNSFDLQSGTVFHLIMK